LASGGESYQTLRTFLPELSARSIAIRGPNGVHMAYDLQACRLAYAWTGEFLGLSPVWDGRGGNQAQVKGPVFWRSPAGFPWDATSSAGAPPNFSNRGDDTSLGAILPHDGKLHPTRLDFKGYKLTDGGPTFRYELRLDGGHVARFTEQVTGMRVATASGVLRAATVSAPADQLIWLNVAASDQPPEWTTADGRSGKLDKPEQSAPASAIVRCHESARPRVFHLREAPAGGAWIVARQANQWELLLRFAAARDDKPVGLSLIELTPNGPDDLNATIIAETQTKVQP
jgi:hypothetical protein